MLSILIPTYNYDITSLVETLHKQAMGTFVDFEILVIEDGSTLFLEENMSVDNLVFCKYEVLNENIGRSAIRNLLADKAKYNHLLFLDCDSEVIMPHYVEKYLSFCSEESVVIGGTAYDPNNSNPQYSLRLKYGRMREAKKATDRAKDGLYSHFSTFNFLIPKSIFQKIRFDENIRGYGHEDTLFGHQIAGLKCEIHHIDNTLLHKGLDDNEVFLRKTKEGTQNLFHLYQTGNYPFLNNQSKLLRTFEKIQKIGILPFISKLSILLKPYIDKNLLGRSPSLALFDLYKLFVLVNLSQSR